MLGCNLRVISKRLLFDKLKANPDARNAVAAWLGTAKTAKWRGLEDIREDLPSADMLGPLAIFDIRRNRYRLITRMHFEGQRIYIKEFLTHARYDKELWKKWL